MTTNHHSRLFIALPLPHPQKTLLHQWQLQLKEQWSFDKWVHPADLHVTLFFLGETDFTQGIAVKERLNLIVKNKSPFLLKMGGLGTFGEPLSPRILYSHIAGEREKLDSLQQEIKNEMVNIGFQSEKRTYNPHLTIARKYRGQEQFPIQMLHSAKMPDTPPYSWTVKECVLYRTLIGQEPLYQVVAVFPFAQNLT